MQAKIIIIHKEKEPLLPRGYKFAAYYQDGRPLYLSGASLDELFERVESVERVIEYRWIDDEEAVQS